MQRRTKRHLERFFLLTGVGCFGIWILSIAGPAIYQDWGSWAFDRKLQGLPATLGGYLATKKDHLLTGHPIPSTQIQQAPLIQPRKSPSATPKTGTVLGRLVIPRLRLSSIVREGASETTLAIALGHIPGTSLPGQYGNVGVAGHRDKLFRGLREIQNNDLVQFETVSGTYSYRVQKTNIVTPSDVGVLKPGPEPELTLVTCYPFYYVGSAPKRFIVSARQISDAPVQVTATQKRETPATFTRVVRLRPPVKPPTGKTMFSVSTNHSRQLAPGVSIGLTQTNALDHRLKGWVWLAGAHRTIWLHDETPIRIYGALDGKTRLLVITRITRNSIGGYLAPSKT